MNLHDHRALRLVERIRSAKSDLYLDFWQYIDGGIPDPRDSWAADRAGCLAIAGSGRRCAKDATLTMPFCHTHVERVEVWFEAQMIWRLQNRMDSEVRRYSDLATDATTVVHQALAVLRDAMRGSVVYFWELEGQGLVKIGTSTNVTTRVAQFRTGKGCTFPPGCDPSRGQLIGTTPGDRLLEAHLHRAYRRHRVVGEWFRMNDEVAEGIADLIAPATEAA